MDRRTCLFDPYKRSCQLKGLTPSFWLSLTLPDEGTTSTMLCLTSLFFDIWAKSFCKVQVELFKHNLDMPHSMFCNPISPHEICVMSDCEM